MTSKHYSNLDLINLVDSFPNAATHPVSHAERLGELSILVHNTHTLGYILPSVAAVLKDAKLSGTHWKFAGKVITLTGETAEERSENIRKTAESWRENGIFDILRGWRNELYTIYSPKGHEYFRLERSACALFGVVHMTAYTTCPLKIWVPRRNPAKPTYGGLLDNTVAGGISSGMSVFETLVKESEEEASFPENLIREKAKAVGHVSYFYQRMKTAGGEEGLLQPEVQYVYDLEVGNDVIPKPCDDEVQDFHLMDVQQVKAELAKGSFKPNCSLVLLDFFIRHGIVAPENEMDYLEIGSRLHRLLEFPTW
ncbi:NUDIX hydrolase domain-like protein [Tuber brumale]|nr:NUDIX hydrolase domain-like protein [Tuber brumale]